MKLPGNCKKINNDSDLISSKHHILEECGQVKAKRHDFFYFIFKLMSDKDDGNDVGKDV